jgi:hypothetical protein
MDTADRRILAARLTSEEWLQVGVAEASIELWDATCEIARDTGVEVTDETVRQLAASIDVAQEAVGALQRLAARVDPAPGAETQKSVVGLDAGIPQ